MSRRLKQDSSVELPKPWPEAEIVARPVKTPDEPRVLVRRRVGNLRGANGEDLIYLPGPSHISLFCGIDGFSLGLEQAGFCTLVQHDSSPEVCWTVMANRPRYFRHSALIQGDIRKTPTSMLLREAGLRVGECDMVTGGPPCQGFSFSNSKARVDGEAQYDPRNDLVFEFLRCVREIQPRNFIFENVAGFVEFDKNEYMKAFLARAHEGYYELVYGLLDCVEYGVPQYRCRFICMGTRRDLVECDGVLGSLPKPQCFSDVDRATIAVARRESLFEICDEVEDLTAAPGIRYFKDRPVLVPPAPLSHTGAGTARRSKTFVEFYKRLRIEEPDRLVMEPIHQGTPAVTGGV